MDIQSIPDIFHSDIKEINNLLGRLKLQLESLNREIIDYRRSQKSKNAWRDFAIGVFEDVVVDYATIELSIKEKRARPLAQQVLDGIGNQMHDPDLPEAITNAFDSIIQQLLTLLERSSEYNKSLTQNTERLVRKLNKILEVQKITTKISRAKTQIDLLMNMKIVYNMSLVSHQATKKQRRKPKPKKKKKVKTSPVKISQKKKKRLNNLFERVKQFGIYHTKLVYSTLFGLVVVAIVGIVASYFGWLPF